MATGIFQRYTAATYFTAATRTRKNETPWDSRFGIATCWKAARIVSKIQTVIIVAYKSQYRCRGLYQKQLLKSRRHPASRNPVARHSCGCLPEGLSSGSLSDGCGLEHNKAPCRQTPQRLETFPLQTALFWAELPIMLTEILPRRQARLSQASGLPCHRHRQPVCRLPSRMFLSRGPRGEWC